MLWFPCCILCKSRLVWGILVVTDVPLSLASFWGEVYGRTKVYPHVCGETSNRPFDRMQLSIATYTSQGSSWFQSSSGLSTGCNNQVDEAEMSADQVSILIRPFDRMQLVVAACGGYACKAFQSSSGLSTGCNHTRTGKVAKRWMFQSSSGLSTGCNTSWEQGGLDGYAFQSSSGLSTGCNHYPSVVLVATCLFQSSSGLSTGCNSVTGRSGPGVSRVSILIRPFDRMQPAAQT